MSKFDHDEVIEKAIRFLCEYAPKEWDRPKRLVMHDLRVGFYLYERNYSLDVIVAGFLHDILEWTECDETLIKEKFGDHVFEIVNANTKDRSIHDPKDRRSDYVQRCLGVGVDALIVKAADTLDSYEFYSEQQNNSEMARSCDIAEKLLSVISPEMSDSIFEELKLILV